MTFIDDKTSRVLIAHSGCAIITVIDRNESESVRHVSSGKDFNPPQVAFNRQKVIVYLSAYLCYASVVNLVAHTLKNTLLT